VFGSPTRKKGFKTIWEKAEKHHRPVTELRVRFRTMRKTTNLRREATGRCRERTTISEVKLATGPERKMLSLL